jgi:23S rRNA pseudoU1915 N3-methylase RlmH
MNYLKFDFRILVLDRVLTYRVRIDENNLTVDFKIITDLEYKSEEENQIAPNEGLVMYSPNASYKETCLVFLDFDFSRCDDYELAEFFKSVAAYAHNNCNIALGGVLGFADFVKKNKL